MLGLRAVAVLPVSQMADVGKALAVTDLVAILRDDEEERHYRVIAEALCLRIPGDFQNPVPVGEHVINGNQDLTFEVAALLNFVIKPVTRVDCFLRAQGIFGNEVAEPLGGENLVKIEWLELLNHGVRERVVQIARPRPGFVHPRNAIVAHHVPGRDAISPLSAILDVVLDQLWEFRFS